MLLRDCHCERPRVCTLPKLWQHNVADRATGERKRELGGRRGEPEDYLAQEFIQLQNWVHHGPKRDGRAMEPSEM